MGAMRSDSSASVKYIELFNFKLFIILRKPAESHNYFFFFNGFTWQSFKKTDKSSKVVFFQRLGSKFSHTVLKLLKMLFLFVSS